MSQPQLITEPEKEGKIKVLSDKYVYGLTATPVRKDGHHPIIFMQCGPIRYRDDAKKQAEKRPFDHFIIPRFTSFNAPLDKEGEDIPIHELYAGIIESEMRNQLIIDDVVPGHAHIVERNFTAICRQASPAV